MLTAACFFLISVAYKLAWTAISSLLSQFSRDYGPEVLLQLNVAYFFPSIPVLMLQTIFNETMDRRFGLPLAALMRFSVGLGGLAILMSYFPALATTHASLLVTTVFVGIFYGVVFGTSYQLASKFPPACTIALTTGFVSSGPVVLFLDLMIKKGPYYTSEGFSSLFSCVGVIISCGLVAASWVVMSNVKKLHLHTQHVQHVALQLPGKWTSLPEPSCSRKLHHRGGSESMGHSGNNATTLDRMESGDHAHFSVDMGHTRFSSSNHGSLLKAGQQVECNGKHKRDMPLSTIMWRVSPAAFSIFLSVGTSMLVFPFFTFVQTTGLLGERLAQVLFYARLVGDIIGRIVPPRLQISTVPKLIGWGIAKAAMTPLLFLAIFRPHLCLGDVGTIILVAIFWVLSGYLNTCSYLLATQLVPSSHKARASGIMTVAFQSSCFIALLMAGMMQRLL